MERRERMTRRVFENAPTPTNTASPGAPDPMRDAFNDLFGRLLRSDGEMEQFLFGDEDEAQRQTARFPAGYRVNEVRIYAIDEVRTGLSVESQYQRFEIDYRWGPPRPRVRVIRKTVYLRNGRRTETPGRMESIPRRDADREPLIFPPDP